MSNTYFQFKNFIIRQDRSAMKVCTDACLFGAWVAEKCLPGAPVHKGILDIGTGTGLLPLMLAQKNLAYFDAVEIEQNAYEQAVENIAASPWNDKIRCMQGDVREMVPGKMYGLIVCNPPFYENDLRSPSARSNMARHNETLTLAALIGIVEKTLSLDGSFAVLLPYQRLSYFTELAMTKGFFLAASVSVKQTTEHLPFRSMLHFRRTEPFCLIEDTVAIRENGRYTEAFTALLKDYYLHL